MSHGIFANEASLRVSASGDGSRQVDTRSGGGGKMRGRSRGDGHWHRGGRGRGGRGRGGGVHPNSRLDDDDEGYDDGQKQSSRGRFTPYSRRGGFGGIKDRLGSRPDGGNTFEFRRGQGRGRGGGRDGGSFDDSSSWRGGRGGRGGGGRGGRGGGGFRSQGQVNDGWNKVTMPYCGQLDEGTLITILSSYLKQPINAVSFHVIADKALFFVEGAQVANALLQASGRVNVPGAGRPAILVRPSKPPKNAQLAPVTVDFDGDMDMDDSGATGGFPGGTGSIQRPHPAVVSETTLPAYLESLGHRYDATSHFLDLSDMYHDDVLQRHGIRCVMRPPVVASLLKLVHEHCPMLLQLDLSNNQLRSLDGLQEISQMTPNLQTLSLGDNQLRRGFYLDKLRGCENLSHLILANNPFVGLFEDETQYMSEVRSRVPSLKMLDCQPFPEKIKFGVEAASALPEVQGNYLPNDQASSIIAQFIQMFFEAYDSDRQKLVDVYSDEAYFSLQVGDSQRRGPNLSEYIKNSRNFIHLKDSGRRTTSLRHRRLQIVTLLTELPATKHDFDSFACDILLLKMDDPACISFTVTGLFEEAKPGFSSQKCLRAFSRTFILVPSPTGDSVRICNDELQVRQPSQQQFQEYQQKSSSVTSLVSETPSVAALGPVASSTVQQNLGGMLTPQQQQVVEQFAAWSGMNIAWAKKCLEENNWDHQKAASDFTRLKSTNSIPAEAFTK